jgi:sugar diacid utilization regulator
MPTVDELLASPALSALVHVTGTGGDREVRQVRLAESLPAIERAPAGSFVLLTPAASAAAGDYRLDMALRLAAAGDVPAVAAFEPWLPSLTAVDIAVRARMALVRVPARAEMTELVLALATEIEGGAARTMTRALTALRRVAAAEPRGVTEVLDAAGEALGTSTEFTETGGGTPVVVAGEVRGSVVAGEQSAAVRLVLPAVAATLARILEASQRAEDIPVRSRGELLTRLLLSEGVLDDDLLTWARQAGLRIDGWHVAVHCEFHADDIESEVRRFEVLDGAARTALTAVQAPGGTWNLARLGRAVVLVCSTPSDPGPQAGLRAARAASAALDAVAARFPVLRGRAGAGAPHEGPTGLRASAAEARTALTTGAGRVRSYDAVGIRRMLMEWYASGTAREAVREQLAPLERLGGAKAKAAIRTLQVYLDEQGSVTRTAEVLHLHRNAVSYRLQHITELAGIDLTDPDQRLALQLACRARLL